MKRLLQSLRWRLTAALAAASIVLLLATGWYVQSSLGRHLAADFDGNLLARAHHLAALTEQEDGVVEFDYVARFQPDYEREESPDHFQFWLDDGQELMRSRHLAQSLPLPPETSAPRFVDVALHDGRVVRQVTLRFAPKTPADDADAIPAPEPGTAPAAPLRELTLAVARGREPLDTALATMRQAILTATIGAIALGILLFGWIALRGLRPVAHIAAQVQGLGAEQLDRRIQLANAPTELSPIVDQLNLLLDRLQASMLRERRFTGNVAHELRTPVAELRSLANVAARWPDDTEAVQQFFGDVGDISTRMEAVIRDLLLLARCQGGVERCEDAPVPLLDVARELVQRHAHDAEGPQVHVEIDPAARGFTDRGKLTILLDNLLDNAREYALPGTEVRCRGGAQHGRFWIEIENAAEPLPAADRARLTEPFWRGDDARTSSRHAGLGLALVDAIARLLQLDVHFTQAADARFCVRVEGPAAPPLSHAQDHRLRA